MKERFVLRINNAKIRKALEQRAEKEYRSINAIITRAIEHYLDDTKRGKGQ